MEPTLPPWDCGGINNNVDYIPVHYIHSADSTKKEGTKGRDCDLMYECVEITHNVSFIKCTDRNKHNFSSVFFVAQIIRK